MHIEKLTLGGFRCFDTAEIEFDPAINVILGDNASGKSSLLEALFLLGRGESFRQTHLADRIRRGGSRFRLNARVRDENGLTRSLAVEGFKNRTQFHKDNDPNARRFDLVETLPLQLIDPNIHRLLEQGPRYRRRFLDWGVFHVEQSFFPAWQRFRHALSQRNRALRNNWPRKDIVAWDALLARDAEHIDACRRSYVDSVAEALPHTIRTLFGDLAIDFDYRSGWPMGEGIGQALAHSLERDQKAGFTQVGPHRADLKVTLGKAHAHNQVSRGQQKLLTTGLLLAQARIMVARRGVSPVLLVDDIAAELGSEFRRVLCEELANLDSQVFITFLDRSFVPKRLQGGARFNLATTEDGVTIV